MPNYRQRPTRTQTHVPVIEIDLSHTIQRLLQNERDWANNTTLATTTNQRAVENVARLTGVRVESISVDERDTNVTITYAPFQAVDHVEATVELTPTNFNVREASEIVNASDRIVSLTETPDLPPVMVSTPNGVNSSVYDYQRRAMEFLRDSNSLSVVRETDSVPVQARSSGEIIRDMMEAVSPRIAETVPPYIGLHTSPVNPPEDVSRMEQTISDYLAINSGSSNLSESPSYFSEQLRSYPTPQQIYNTIPITGGGGGMFTPPVTGFSSMSFHSTDANTYYEIGRSPSVSEEIYSYLKSKLGSDGVDINSNNYKQVLDACINAKPFALESKASYCIGLVEEFGDPRILKTKLSISDGYVNELSQQITTLNQEIDTARTLRANLVSIAELAMDACYAHEDMEDLGDKISDVLKVSEDL